MVFTSLEQNNAVELIEGVPTGNYRTGLALLAQYLCAEFGTSHEDLACALVEVPA
jgi:hypothetical protein